MIHSGSPRTMTIPLIIGDLNSTINLHTNTAGMAWD